MTYTTISSGQFGFVLPSSFGTTLTLGIFCTEDFVSDDGKLYLASAGDSLSANFVAQVAVTVVSGVGTFASYSLPKTDLATPNTVRYFARLFTSHRSATQYYPFENFHLRSSLGDSINFLAWWNDNQQAYRAQLDTYPTTTQMNTAIAAAINAPATTTQLGIAEISVTPVNVALPIAVGDNDPRLVVLANQFSGANLAIKINAAFASLSGTAGIVEVKGGGSLGATVVTIPDNCTLRLHAGTYTSAHANDGTAYILLGSNSTVEGDGWGTILTESSVSGALPVIAPTGLGSGALGGGFHDLRVRNLRINGNGLSNVDSAATTIHLGNVTRAVVENVFLYQTNCNGITSGGNSTNGYHAEDVTIRNCLFDQVAEQNLASVNTQNFHFDYNTFVRGGKPITGTAFTYIDLEGNVATDYNRRFTIIGNIIDHRESPSNVAGFGMSINAAGGLADNVGEGVIAHNVLIGGSIKNPPGLNGLMATGIYLQGMHNVLVTDNHITKTSGQPGIIDENGQSNTITNNDLRTCGGGGNMMMLLSGTTTESYVVNNIMSTNQAGTEGSTSIGIEERNTCSGNFFDRNQFYGATGLMVGTSSLGAGSIVTSEIINGVYQARRISLVGTTSGSLVLTVPAIVGTRTLTLPAGTTDFSATGGTSQVVKQTSAGGAFTVAQLAASDLSNGTTGTGAVMLAAAPTWTGAANGGSLLLTSSVTASKFVGLAGLSNFFKGGDVPSASTITPTGNVQHVTGVTTITAISTTGLNDGTEIILIFDGNCTVQNGASLKLAGGVDFSATANDVLKVVLGGGGVFFEVSRSVN